MKRYIKSATTIDENGNPSGSYYIVLFMPKTRIDFKSANADKQMDTLYFDNFHDAYNCYLHNTDMETPTEHSWDKLEDWEIADMQEKIKNTKWYIEQGEYNA